MIIRGTPFSWNRIGYVALHLRNLSSWLVDASLSFLSVVFDGLNLCWLPADSLVMTFDVSLTALSAWSIEFEIAASLHSLILVDSSLVLARLFIWIDGFGVLLMAFESLVFSTLTFVLQAACVALVAAAALHALELDDELEYSFMSGRLSLSLSSSFACSNENFFSQMAIFV